MILTAVAAGTAATQEMTVVVGSHLGGQVPNMNMLLVMTLIVVAWGLCTAMMIADRPAIFPQTLILVIVVMQILQLVPLPPIAILSTDL